MSNGLERVFSKGHQYHDVVFYDTKEGKYYDQSTDLYIENDELARYGLKS